MAPSKKHFKLTDDLQDCLELQQKNARLRRRRNRAIFTIIILVFFCGMIESYVVIQRVTRDHNQFAVHTGGTSKITSNMRDDGLPPPGHAVASVPAPHRKTPYLTRSFHEQLSHWNKKPAKAAKKGRPSQIPLNPPEQPGEEAGVADKPAPITADSGKMPENQPNPGTNDSGPDAGSFTISPWDDYPLTQITSSGVLFGHYPMNRGGLIFVTDCKDCDWSINVTGAVPLNNENDYSNKAVISAGSPDLLLNKAAAITIISGRYYAYRIQNKTKRIFRFYKVSVNPGETLIIRISKK